MSAADLFAARIRRESRERRNSEERLRAVVDTAADGIITIDSFRFDWASTRIQKGLVHLSFSKGLEQKLLEFGWDGASLANAIARAQQFRAEHFAHRD